MSTVEFDLLCAFEVHSVQDIRAILDAGFDMRQSIKGKSIVNSLIEMYSRSDQFPDCLRLLLERTQLPWWAAHEYRTRRGVTTCHRSAINGEPPGWRPEGASRRSSAVPHRQ